MYLTSYGTSASTSQLEDYVGDIYRDSARIRSLVFRGRDDGLIGSYQGEGISGVVFRVDVVDVRRNYYCCYL